ncbi:unnamed protein product [Rotaria sp. Silwood1]|nr:unnamed protein product [Rotaria sp. Silwood1]
MLWAVINWRLIDCFTSYTHNMNRSRNIGIRQGYGNGTFSSEITYSTGFESSPYWVAVEDFNNDTLLDIAVANYGTHNIGIFLGHGNGYFSDQLTFSLGSSRPVSLAIGDFNQDKQLDIAVINNGTFDVVILLGYGNGSFQIHTSYHMGYDSMPYSIDAADFNNDQQLDLVVVNYGTSDIALLLATGNGTFSIRKYSTGNGSHPCSVATGYFNDDFYIDIAVVNSATETISILVGDGHGTFITKATYSTGFQSNPQFIAVGRFSNNNTIDIIVANSGKDNVAVLEGNGDGTFSTKATHSTGYNSNPCSLAVGIFANDNMSDLVIVNKNINSILILRSYTMNLTANQTRYSMDEESFPKSIVVDDFNNDAKLDIIITDTIDSSVDLFIGYSNGTFEYQEAFSTLEDKVTPYLITVGDFNNDKQPDIAVCMLLMNEVRIYLGDGHGYFEKGYIYLAGNRSIPSSITTGDFNNDGNLDIIVANDIGENVAILLGYGNGAFAQAINYPTGYYSPLFISVGDFNNDNLLDFASANYDSHNLSIYLSNGNATFQSPIPVSTSIYYAKFLTVRDLNNDARDDIVVTFPDSSTIGVFLGYGDGNFQDMKTYSTDVGTSPYRAVLSDFNKDAVVDIAVLNPENSSINVFFGNSDGTFSRKLTLHIEYAFDSYSIAIGDFNNDKEDDIVVGNLGSNDLSVLLLQYQPSFVSSSVYRQGSSSHPSSVTISDFNNDQQMDIVITNAGNDTVQILLGYREGTFTNIITYSTGINVHPQHVVAADFNKDNQLDIAVINYWTSDLRVFLTSGTETSAVASEYATGYKSFPRSIAAGDFNKDGWIDVVVANSATNNIGVFLGFDYPTFRSHNIVLQKRDSIPYYVAIGDFNKDSQWDIAIACRKTNNIAVVLGKGNGTFAKEQLYALPVSADPRSLVIGDFNNDNISDIAVANSRKKSISILLGNGNGTFAPHMSQKTIDASPVSIAVGDFNNDSRQDIVVALEYANSIGIFIGIGNGSFQNQISYQMPRESSPVWVAVGDFNNDNVQDIVVTNFYGHSVGILLGYGNGSFTHVTVFSTGNSSGPCSIAIGDFNKDNRMDIVVANRNARNVGVFLGYGNGTFSSQITYTTGSGSMLVSIAVDDLNNDTVLDIAISDFRGGRGNIGVLYGLGNGKFLVPKIYSTGVNSDPSSLAIGDFDNDGRQDFVVSNSKKNNIGIMLRNKSEPFGKQTTFSMGKNAKPYSVVISDFNHDDQLDIAVANYMANNVSILLGYGNGSFAKQVNYSTGLYSGPKSMAVGDFNHDKQVDIVVVNSNTSNIYIFLGNGNGTFTFSQSYLTGQSSEPSSVAVADLNKDNQTDIVVTNSGTSNVLVFFGLDNGKFSSPKSYSLEYESRPASVAIGDINNDTLLDIVVAKYGLGYVEVLLQTC